MPIALLLGYAAMMIIVMVAFTVAFLALPRESVYELQSWQPSTLWLALDIGICLVAGFIGGAVATMIGRKRAGILLAFIVVIVSLVVAWSVQSAPRDLEGRPEFPTKDMSFMDGGKWTDMPSWMPWAHGGIGFISVLMGTSFAGRRSKHE